ncbi:MAG: hypothetical protein ACJAQT_000551 [Akkermansiaceae bacterium]
MDFFAAEDVNGAVLSDMNAIDTGGDFRDGVGRAGCRVEPGEGVVRENDDAALEGAGGEGFSPFTREISVGAVPAGALRARDEMRSVKRTRNGDM